MKVLLGVSGSVAAKLTQKIDSLLMQNGHEVKIVLTKSAEHFVNKDDVYYLTDEDEWKRYEKHQGVLHIELTQWADRFIVCPCSASMLAKLSMGMSDSLLTSCARAWNFDKKMFIAPAMNPQMWNHPITSQQLKILKKWGVEIIEPQEKKLFCGDTGIGALAQIEDIIKVVEHG